jgi:hypothetical protein
MKITKITSEDHKDEIVGDVSGYYYGRHHQPLPVYLTRKSPIYRAAFMKSYKRGRLKALLEGKTK